MAESKASRAERRKLAAQSRKPGEPEITKQGTRHLTGTCAGCVFWDTADPGVSPGTGVCRGDVPQLITVGSANGNVMQALWPITAFSVVCGKHETPEEYFARKRMETNGAQTER